MTDIQPTKKAAEFMAENKKSIVVSGSAKDGGGGVYTLKNGKRFDLSLEDMRSMPMPDWGFGETE